MSRGGYYDGLDVKVNAPFNLDLFSEAQTIDSSAPYWSGIEKI